MNGFLPINGLVWFFLVDIHRHSWFIGTRCNGMVVRARVVMGHHMRRRKAIVAMRMTVVKRNIMKYMAPPANVIGLDQPYRKDCTGDARCCLWRENSHDRGCLAEIGDIFSVAEPPTGRHPNQSILDAIGSGASVISMCRDLCCAVMDERLSTRIAFPVCPRVSSLK